VHSCLAGIFLRNQNGMSEHNWDCPDLLISGYPLDSTCIDALPPVWGKVRVGGRFSSIEWRDEIKKSGRILYGTRPL